MLYMHAEDGKRLSDRVDRVSQERRPRREQVRVRRGVLEVRGEGECSQGGEHALMSSHQPLSPTTRALSFSKRAKEKTNHSNPDMNPPTRQKLVHDRPLGRKHIRVPSVLLLLLLFLRESWAGVVDRSGTDHPAIAGLHHPARGMRGWSELVWLSEHARFAAVV